MTLAQAVAAPRVHHNGLPDVVGWEPAGLSPQVRAELHGDGLRAVEGAGVHGNGERHPRDAARTRGSARPAGGRRCRRLVGAVVTRKSSPGGVRGQPVPPAASRRSPSLSSWPCSSVSDSPNWSGLDAHTRVRGLRTAENSTSLLHWPWYSRAASTIANKARAEASRNAHVLLPVRRGS